MDMYLGKRIKHRESCSKSNDKCIPLRRLHFIYQQFPLARSFPRSLFDGVETFKSLRADKPGPEPADSD